MSAPGNYAATEILSDRRWVQIRALRPDDKDDMLAAVGRTGTQSVPRRFFVVKRGGFSERAGLLHEYRFSQSRGPSISLTKMPSGGGRRRII